MKDKFYDELKKIKNITVYKNVNVKDENTLKMDAIFLYKVEISSFAAVKKVFKIIEKYNIKYYLIGNGSNILFSKKFYEGILIKIKPINSSYINIISAGDKLNLINNKYIKKGILSLDFLAGVPCSIGGAIYMNAGAFNEKMSDVIEYVYAYDIEKSKFKVFKNDECQFGYRDSYFKYHNFIILGAKVKCKYMDVIELEKMHKQRLLLRVKKMPLEYPNAGSVFKNPKENFAGELIENLGLKGKIVGGAMISLKHANVIVNYNNAQYEDIETLITLIQNEVYIKYKINLELEIIILK